MGSGNTGRPAGRRVERAPRVKSRRGAKINGVKIRTWKQNGEIEGRLPTSLLAPSKAVGPVRPTAVWRSEGKSSKREESESHRCERWENRRRRRPPK